MHKHSLDAIARLEDEIVVSMSTGVKYNYIRISGSKFMLYYSGLTAIFV